MYDLESSDAAEWAALSSVNREGLPTLSLNLKSYPRVPFGMFHEGSDYVLKRIVNDEFACTDRLSQHGFLLENSRNQNYLTDASR